jgi:two-component sensor histidine kinase
MTTRWFSGLTWNGIAGIALLCLVNALRRTSRDLDAVVPPDGAIVFLLEWSIRTIQAAALGLVVAVPVALAVVATHNLAPSMPVRRYTALAVAVALSCAAGVALMIAIQQGRAWSYIEDQSLFDPFVVALVRYGLLCALVAIVFVYLRAADESVARARKAERDRAYFVQRMEEARLKMLQAQIEPHFLFNTLANVRGLYGIDATTADRMLENVIRYFKAALPEMRATHSTLRREAALTTAYLEIQAIRMGRRLDFVVDVPEALADVQFPPLMLLTLTENAIKHGLAPLRGGGALRVSAVATSGELHVRVADSGRGFTQTSGGGTGLANIRARLGALYGAAGRLVVARNDPRGVVATISVPLATSSA